MRITYKVRGADDRVPPAPVVGSGGGGPSWLVVALVAAGVLYFSNQEKVNSWLSRVSQPTSAKAK